MELQENRLASFFGRQDGLIWPHTERSHPYCTPKILASTGFYFSPTTNVPDMCQCHYCGIRLRDWVPTDKPWKEHKKHQPHCPFILENSSDQYMGFNLFGEEPQPTKRITNLEKSENVNSIILSEEMKLRGQFVSDLLFSLINPQSDWNFDAEVLDLSPKSLIPQIKETNN